MPAPPIVKLVESIVFAGDNKNIDVIKNLVNSFAKNNNLTKEKKEENLLSRLKNIAGQNAAFESSITKESYEKHFIGKRDKETDDVKNEIEKDIDILHDALNDVVIKAINIEKAFLALEFRNIDKLLSSLKSDVWPNFVNNNLHVINAAEFSFLEDEQQRQQTRQNIMKDIKHLLDQMNNNISTSNTEN